MGLQGLSVQLGIGRTGNTRLATTYAHKGIYEAPYPPSGDRWTLGKMIFRIGPHDEGIDINFDEDQF